MKARIAPTTDRQTCLALRHAVFVMEQGVPVSEEADALDDVAVHLLASVDGTPVGTARVITDGATATIGRVCVLPAVRGAGVGVDLIHAALDIARAQPGVTRASLGSQVQAIGFYARLGFVAHGPEYMDAGIAHRHMVRDL